MLVVDVHHWLTEEQLIHVYSIGQMSPGPNMMMVAEIGQIVAGRSARSSARWPSSSRRASSRSVSAVSGAASEGGPGAIRSRKGLGTVAIGLAVGGLITFGKSAITGWIPVVLALLTFVALNRTKVNPIWFILGSGVVGVFALR